MRSLGLFAVAWAGVLLSGPAPSADWPRPVLVWPSGPLEVRAAFARPLDAALVGGLVGRTIDFAIGRSEGPAGERGIGHLRIAAARLDDDGRTLVLATDPHPFDTTYTLPLSPAERPSYGLSGVEANWQEREADEPRSAAWWPSLSVEATRRATLGSVEHERAFALLSRPGQLTLRTQLAVPIGKTRLRLTSNVPFRATLGNADQASADVGKGIQQVAFAFEATDAPDELTVVLPTGPTAPTLTAFHGSAADPADRSLPDRALLAPWAPARPTATSNRFEAPYPLEGGEPTRGEAVFYSEEAKCAVCHAVRGKGGNVGPDLTRPRQRDLLSLYRAIAEPSDEIHPEYVAYTIATRDGQIAVGVVRAEGPDAVKVLDTNGQSTLLKRSELQLFRPSSTSVMPVGLAGVLGEQRIRDLLAFLRAE